MTSVMSLPILEKTVIGGLIEIPRMISGLWQLAGGHDAEVNIDESAKFMKPLIEVGLDCFDMADHYGSAELVIGQYNANSNKKITAFTKWCPEENGVKTYEQAEAAVNLALSRMDQKQIDLMQYHIWDYTDDTYWHNLDHLRKLQEQGKIKCIGLTNTDAAHLELLLDTGFPIASNQVSCSVVDRRLVRGRLSSLCTERGVAILAYGALLGGYISEKWLGQPEPQFSESLNWSLRKYLRFIKAAGGWQPFQNVLQALSILAEKHRVTIAAIATRYVLDLPAVSAVIVGSRLSPESEKYTRSNLATFSFRLSDEDSALIATAQDGLEDIPGDSGDEYRRTSYLTAKGDLSDHIKKRCRASELKAALDTNQRIEYSSGSKWEPIAGYCRAVRTGNIIRVSGTTANSPLPAIAALGGSSARSQTVATLDIIERALKALGGSLSDVVRTRIMIQRSKDAGDVGRAHGWTFKCAGVHPSNTLVVSGLIGEEFLAEIEAEAEVGCEGVLRI